MIVVGHKNPDTDTVLSALVQAWILTNLRGIKAEARIAGKPNQETKFVLEHFEVQAPELIESLSAGEEYFLVDTNNPEEIVAGFEQAELKGIVDHHKLFGGLMSASPISVTMLPLGSLVSVLYYTLSEEEKTNLPAEIKKLVFAGLVADTLAYRSATTTDTDREIGKRLSAELGIDAEELGQKMFAAKSDVSSYNAEELWQLDSKVFDSAKGRVLIAAAETTDPAQIINRLDELAAAEVSVKAKLNADFAFYVIIDILQEKTQIVALTAEEQEFVAALFGQNYDPANGIVVNKLLSRKKHIAPLVSELKS